MFDLQHFKNNLFHLTSIDQCNDLCIDIFHYQFEHNPVYHKFVQTLGRNLSLVHTFRDIPFLPIEFFKNHKIITGISTPDIIFTSSGTTGSATSSHYVADLELYRRSFTAGFEFFYGDISQYAILGLLPSYLEREGSSLIYMTEELIRLSNNPYSGFYLKHTGEMLETAKKAASKGYKVFVLGVSFALLEFAQEPKSLPEGTIIMETGGMKGRRKELTRLELYSILKEAFNIEKIHSEYGMTELLSQAYSSDNGVFQTPPWMKVLIRDMNDPFAFLPENKTGGINIIDLANINSCCFIATQDLGKLNNEGAFEVLGRFDDSDIRGCNLMIE